MPFAYTEHIKSIDNPYYLSVNDGVVGLNFRPTSNIVLKVEYARAFLHDGSQLGSLTMDLVDSQLAVVF